MKTKKLFLLVAVAALSTYGFSQELSVNTLNKDVMSQDNTYPDKADKLELSDRNASFSRSSKYKNLREFIYSNIEFPDDARSIGTSGDVIVHFEILANGSLGEIYFIKSPDPSFSKEAERVLRLAPGFIPAVKEGEIVPSYEQIKITFKLN